VVRTTPEQNAQTVDDNSTFEIEAAIEGGDVVATTLATNGPPRQRLERMLASGVDAEPLCDLDTQRAELALVEADVPTLYGLGPWPSGGFGWIACYGEQGGEVVLQHLQVSAAEPMAQARDLLGDDAERAVAELTLAAAERLRADRRDHGRAERLERQVADGHNLAVLPVRRLRAAIIEAMVEDGLSLCELARRAGFLAPGARPDVSWVERRVGLRSEVCSRTGRRVTRRVIGYELFVRLVWALGRDPVDLGA
jgi:hypothetical protein